MDDESPLDVFAQQIRAAEAKREAAEEEFSQTPRWRFRQRTRRERRVQRRREQERELIALVETLPEELTELR